LEIAGDFFGPANVDRNIRIRVFMPASSATPAFEANVTISREYSASGTRRLNRFPQMGSILSAFVFFQETDQADVYDFWWQADKAIVAARYDSWTQARKSQHGRGRLAIVVPAPVPRIIDSL